jgi:hypothetical protein
MFREIDLILKMLGPNNCLISKVPAIKMILILKTFNFIKTAFVLVKLKTHAHKSMILSMDFVCVQNNSTKIMHGRLNSNQLFCSHVLFLLQQKKAQERLLCRLI